MGWMKMDLELFNVLKVEWPPGRCFCGVGVGL